MKLSRTIFVLITLMLLFTGVGCDRIASIAPVSLPATVTAAGIDFPVASQPDITEIANLVNTQVSDLEKEVVSKDGVSETATEVPTATPEATATPLTTAVPTQTPVPPTPTPLYATTYTLQKGEWAICIARRYNLNLDEFFAINHIGMHTNNLPVGYVLALPGGGSWNEAYGPRYWHLHPATYQVQPGDTLNSVACFFGDVSPQAIKDANSLPDNYTLSIGQNLSIP